jgi:hypothetical protein
MLSYEKLEKVVYPPQIPVIRNSRHSSVSQAWRKVNQAEKQPDDKTTGDVDQECSGGKGAGEMPGDQYLHEDSGL